MAKRRLNVRRGAGIRANPAALAALALLAVAIALATLARNANRDGEELGPAAEGRAALDDALGAGAAGVAPPVRDTAEAIAGVGAAIGARERIARLQDENAELRQWRSLALALAERNERYEALLGMPADALFDTLKPGAGVSARLVIDAGGPFRRTLLANAGADHGVQLGFVAVNEHGLVGRVVALGRRTSRVLMLDDYNSRVPVMGQSSRVRAVLVGSAAGAPRLDGPIAIEPPALDFVVEGSRSLRNGEAIVTSGDGGLFPPGVTIGHAAQDSAGRWRVRLATAAGPIDFVRLIPFSRPPRPEDEPVDEAPPPLAAVTPRALVTAPLAATPAVPTRRAEPAPPVREAALEDTPPPAPEASPPPEPVAGAPIAPSTASGDRPAPANPGPVNPGPANAGAIE